MPGGLAPVAGGCSTWRARLRLIVRRDLDRCSRNECLFAVDPFESSPSSLPNLVDRVIGSYRAAAVDFVGSAPPTSLSIDTTHPDPAPPAAQEAVRHRRF